MSKFIWGLLVFLIGAVGAVVGMTQIASSPDMTIGLVWGGVIFVGFIMAVIGGLMMKG